MSDARHAERRQFGRRESAIHAVALVSGRAPAHCIVHNFSERGALLEFKETFTPPYRFRLVVESKGVDVVCEVRHQGNYGVGVYFASGSAAGLFEAPVAPVSLPMSQPAPCQPPKPRASPPSGADLRSALFGIRQKQADIVRTIDATNGRLIRGS